MALPSSGQLALSQISDEFGGGSRTNVNLRTLSAAAGLSTPDGFNEFYGLSAFTPPAIQSGISYTGNGTDANPYVITNPTLQLLIDDIYDEEFLFYIGTVYTRRFSVGGTQPNFIEFLVQEAGTYTVTCDIIAGTVSANTQDGSGGELVFYRDFSTMTPNLNAYTNSTNAFNPMRDAGPIVTNQYVASVGQRFNLWFNIYSWNVNWSLSNFQIRVHFTKVS